MSARPALIGTAGGIAVALATFWACGVDRRSDQLACSSSATCSAGRVCMQNYCVIGMFMDAHVDGPPPDAFVCPPGCTSCDEASQTCNITGTGSGNVSCPPGWKCTITCADTGACADVQCQQAVSCDVTCGSDGACGNILCDAASCTTHCTGFGGSAGSACGALECTTGSCTADCMGSNACGDVSCTSGACSTMCGGGSAACGNLTCGTGRCDANCMGSDACGTISCPSSCRCDVTCPTGDCGSNTCPVTPQNKNCTVGGQAGANCSSAASPQCRKC